MTRILLDTHIWIWYINGNKELSKPIQNRINAAIQQGEAYVAAISSWEISMLAAKERITLNMPCLEWINQSLEIGHLQIVPLTPAIAVESTQLPGHFHVDPADRIIVATARADKLTLLTRDSKILDYSQNKYVSTIKA